MTVLKIVMIAVVVVNRRMHVAMRVDRTVMSVRMNVRNTIHAGGLMTMRPHRRNDSHGNQAAKHQDGLFANHRIKFNLSYSSNQR